MKLYVVNNLRIRKYNLPEKVEGAFLFKYKSAESQIEHLINIEAVEGKWLLKNSENVHINFQNKVCNEIFLTNYFCVPLSLFGTSSFCFIFTLPSNDNQTINLSTENVPCISIGSDPKCNIAFHSELLLPVQAEIRYSEGLWYLLANNDERCLVYLNDMRVLSTVKLKIGDVIFINGLKIIWMGKFVKVNNPNSQLEIFNLVTIGNTYNIDNRAVAPVEEDKKNIDLYKEDDYFSHTPRIYEVNEPQEVNIDAPPANQNSGEDLPFLLSIGSSLTMVSSSFVTGYNVYYNISSGNKTLLDSLPSILMIVAMIIGSILIPKLASRYQRKKKIAREELRQKKYTEYIQKKESEIQLILKNQTQVLYENSIHPSECVRIIEQKNRNLWNREINDEDFIKVRLGLGNIPSLLTINAPKEKFQLDDDNLEQMVYALPDKYKMLTNVPITISFKDDKIFTFLTDCKFENDFINSILLQLITFHSALDLKIVVLTDDNNKDRWNYIKYLPHCFSDDKQLRFFATNTEEVKTVCTFLDNEYSNRRLKKTAAEESENEKSKEKEDSERINYYPYYLVITDSFRRIRNNKFIDTFLSDRNNYGFSFVIFEKNMKNLPKESDKFAGIYDTDCGLFNRELRNEGNSQFKADYDPTINMIDLARKVSNIPIQSKEEAMQLPTSISFMEMFQVGKIEQFNVTNRWVTNNPTVSLQATIGVHKNGDLFKLDLHEKKDGPHGLIAGSTGSGKSEFIITYILSMAVNYHPYEVQFVLIDYKGGGLAGAFENRETGVCIPHLAGTITNLDVSEMNRTLVSIQSELKRRQSKFNEVRDSLGESTMDIYKYQRLYREGTITEPISHLFIVSDEFAELKSQQPEFMSQLISTARIGRSLGVHLILATQKPSGVVNDQIWSNSKFKICLKVQSRADSMEMLKRPEAASIKETGRFYLQVGYDEYFDIGQSGWAGAPYIPSERIIRKIDDSCNFIDNTGTVIKSINDVIKKVDVKDDLGDQLTNIVKHLNQIAVKENIVAKKLWLPSLSDFISITQLESKYGKTTEPYVIVPTIGEFDAPSQQKQGLVSINLTKDGNTLIYGIPGSGKENLLSTIIYSIITNHSPDEVNMYVGDFGAETLKIFQKVPHIGDVFTVNENDKLNSFLQVIDKEFERRKKEFTDYGGSYEEYLKLSGKKEPLFITILNSFEIFTETYPKLADVFSTIFRDGSKYGMVFIVTTSVSNSLRSRVAQNFPNKICLQMPNASDYKELIGAPKGLVPPPKFGRGAYSIDGNCNEFQSASICERENINLSIRNIIQELKQKYNNAKVKRIPVLPKVCYVEDITFELKGLDVLPIGIEINSLEVYVYDFTKNNINLVVGKYISNHIYFLYALIHQFLMLQNVKVKVIDTLGVYKGNYQNVDVYNSNFDQVIGSLHNELAVEKNNAATTVYLMIGIKDLKSKLTADNVTLFETIFNNAKSYEKSKFIFADDYASIKDLSVDNWYRNNVDNTFGIWLGEEVGTQMAISVMSLSMDDKKIMFPCIGYPIYKGNHMIVKYAVDGVEREDEE